MAKLTDELKKEGGKYFQLGIHKVQIATVVQGFTEDKDKREYFDFTVVDDLNSEDPTEADVRLWFHTDKAIKYSFSIIRGIFTHNAPEGKAEAVKEQLQKVDDTDELIKLCEKLVGKECWLEVSEDANRTYAVKDAEGNETGEQKPSINRNITGYEPQPKQVSAPAANASAPASGGSSDEDVMAGF